MAYSLIETVNVERLNALIEHKSLAEVERKQLKAYRNKVMDGSVQVTYQKRLDMGRRYADNSLSLQNFKKNIRHSLCYDNKMDMDMVNCHPVLLSQYCNKNGIICDRLDDYILHRDSHLQELMTACSINRNLAKDFVLCVMYLGNQGDFMTTWGITTMPPSWLDELQASMKNISDMIVALNPTIYEKVSACKDKERKNKIASTVSYVAQILEDDILMSAVGKLTDLGFKVETLCFDGVLLTKQEITEETLAEVSAHCFQKTGYQVRFEMKPMMNVLNVEDEEVMDVKKLIHLKVQSTTQNEKMKFFDQLNAKAQKEILKQKEDEDKRNHLKELKLKSEYFEKFHFKVMSPPCFGRLAYNKISLLSSGEIEQQYENVVMNNHTFVSLWRKSESIRTFENVDFLPYPRECKSHTLNTFNGLKIERVKDGQGDYGIFVKHLDVLTGHDPKGTDYLLNYLSHLVQRPGELPRVALVFQSDQGVGKNIFFENFAHSILGTEYMLQTAEMDKIIGRFSMINNKLLVIMDETSGKDSFSNSDKIKNIITAEQVAWERKGIDGVNINNCGRYIFFSNNSTPVKIEHSDRRYVVYKCANDVQNNSIYFKELVKHFKDDKIVRAFYDFLMSRDISNWDSINDRPITRAYQDIQSANIPAMANYLTEQILVFENATPEEKNLLIKQSATELFNHFVSWLKQNGFHKMEYTSTKFGREICDYEGIEKKKSMGVMVYMFDFQVLKDHLVKKRWME
jgi:hypothetical protein